MWRSKNKAKRGLGLSELWGFSFSFRKQCNRCGANKPNNDWNSTEIIPHHGHPWGSGYHENVPPYYQSNVRHTSKNGWVTTENPQPFRAPPQYSHHSGWTTTDIGNQRSEHTSTAGPTGADNTFNYPPRPPPQQRPLQPSNRTYQTTDYNRRPGQTTWNQYTYGMPHRRGV
eukprot:UN29340